MSAARPGSPGSIRRFLALSPRQRALWMSAWWSLLRADLRLRISPARALSRALASTASGASAAMPDARTADLARAVASAAAHHLWPMRCLTRSLALWRLLDRRGIAARVRIGVRKEPAGLAAHAWVEVGGAAVGEPEAIEARFLPLVEPRAGAS